MAVSKVVYHTSSSDTSGTTWMDVTPDTVTSSKLLSGETATDASGTQVTGNIATKTSADLTVSRYTVTAPAGYYASSASKGVEVGGSSGLSNDISYNTSTNRLSVVSTVGTEGYYLANTSKTSNFIPGSITNMPTQAATTITPTTSSQTAVAANKWTTGAVTVAAIPSQYIVPSGTINITDNGTVDVTNYASANVSVSGGGVTYGAFTVTKDSSITSYSSSIGFIDYVEYGSVRIPLPRKLINGTNTYYGHGIVDSDGYMYIAFLGSGDAYWPSVTATSGTATYVVSAPANSPFNNVTTYAHYNTIVWYKLTPDAVVTMTYYNNN